MRPLVALTFTVLVLSHDAAAADRLCDTASTSATTPPWSTRRTSRCGPVTPRSTAMAFELRSRPGTTAHSSCMNSSTSGRASGGPGSRGTRLVSAIDPSRGKRQDGGSHRSGRDSKGGSASPIPRFDRAPAKPPGGGSGFNPSRCGHQAGAEHARRSGSRLGRIASGAADAAPACACRASISI